MKNGQELINEKKFTNSYYLCLLFFIIEAIWGLFQLVTNHFTYACGSFINSGPFSCFLAVVLPIILRLYQISLIRIVKYCCIFAISLACILIPFLLSRTALFAALIGLSVIFIPDNLNIEKFRNNATPKNWAVLIMCSFLLVAFVAYLLLIKINSANGRFLIWKIVLEYIDNDILCNGVGWDNVATTYANLQERYFSSGIATQYDEILADTPNFLFNEFLHCLMAFGVIGLIALIGIFVYIIVLCNKCELKGLKGTFISLCIVMFFSYPLHCWEFWCCLLILGISLLFIVRSILKKLVIFLYLLLCCYFGYYNFAFSKNQYKYFQTALSLHNNANYALSNQILENFVVNKSPSLEVLYLAAKNYYLQGNTERAIYYYIKSANRVPHRLYPHYKLMQIYFEHNDIDKAKREAELIVNKQIKIKSPATDEMKDYAKKILNSI